MVSRKARLACDLGPACRLESNARLRWSPCSFYERHMVRNRIDIARELYEGFASGDREVVEQRLGQDFTFSAPPDPLLDRDGYFERCWPGAGSDQSFDFKRLVEAGNEVIVTYERTRG